MSAVPIFQFAESELEVKEEAGEVSVEVTRNGDVTQTSSVRCYTRQASAKVMMDFVERPNTDDSLVTFQPGAQSSDLINLPDDALRRDDLFDVLFRAKFKADSNVPLSLTSNTSL